MGSRLVEIETTRQLGHTERLSRPTGKEIEQGDHPIDPRRGSGHQNTPFTRGAPGGADDKACCPSGRPGEGDRHRADGLGDDLVASVVGMDPVGQVLRTDHGCTGKQAD